MTALIVGGGGGGAPQHDFSTLAQLANQPTIQPDVQPLCVSDKLGVANRLDGWSGREEEEGGRRGGERHFN